MRRWRHAPLLATFTLVSQPLWLALARRTIAMGTGASLDRPELAAVVERQITDGVSRALDPTTASA